MESPNLPSLSASKDEGGDAGQPSPNPDGQQPAESTDQHADQPADETQEEPEQVLPTFLPPVQLEDLGPQHVHKILPKDPTALLGKRLGPLVRDMANHTGCHPCMPIPFLLSSLCGVLGSGLKITPHISLSHVLSPNLWGTVVAASGSGKSPQIELILHAIRGCEFILPHIFDAEPITILGSSKTMESLVADLLRTPGNQLLSVTHEFSRIFSQLGQYKAAGGGQADMANILVLRDCGRLEDTTLGRGKVVIENAKMTYTGAFTREGYDNLIQNKSQRGSGLEARLSPLFVPSSYMSPGQLLKAHKERPPPSADAASSGSMGQLRTELANHFASLDVAAPNPSSSSSSPGGRSGRESAGRGSGPVTPVIPTGVAQPLSSESCLAAALSRIQGVAVADAQTAERLAKQRRLNDPVLLDLAMLMLGCVLWCRGFDPQSRTWAPVPKLMVLSESPDQPDPTSGNAPLGGLSAFAIYDRVYRQARVLHDALHQVGCDDLASIVNKFPGHCLEAAAVLQASEEVSLIMQERAPPSPEVSPDSDSSRTGADEPRVVSAVNMMHAVDLMRIILAQRIMQQSAAAAYPALRALVPSLQLIHPASLLACESSQQQAGGSSVLDDDSAGFEPSQWVDILKRILMVQTTSNSALAAPIDVYKAMVVQQKVRVPSKQGGAVLEDPSAHAVSSTEFAFKDGQAWLGPYFRQTLPRSSYSNGKLFTSFKLDKVPIIKLAGGDARAVAVVFDVLTGGYQGDEKDAPSYSALKDPTAMHLGDLSDFPAICRTVGSGAKQYLEKKIPAEQPDNREAELEELLQLQSDLRPYDMLLGEFYFPLGKRLQEVQVSVDEFRARAQQLLHQRRLDQMVNVNMLRGSGVAGVGGIGSGGIGSGGSYRGGVSGGQLSGHPSQG